jgi:hypothetical protein
MYSGGYVNGKPEGYGEYVWKNGSSFKGIFQNGLRHGHGTWKRFTDDENSDAYEGEYVNDKKCGYGIFKWSNGNLYKGSFFDDVRHGYGEMYWNDTSYYKGMWDKGQQHGEGEIVCLIVHFLAHSKWRNKAWYLRLECDGRRPTDQRTLAVAEHTNQAIQPA